MSWQTFFAMGGFAPFVWSSFSLVIFMMSFAGFLVFKRYRLRLKQFRLQNKESQR